MGHLRLDSVITESYTQRDRKAEEEGSEGEAMSSTGLSRSDGAKQKMWFSAEGMKQRKFKEKKQTHEDRQEMHPRCVFECEIIGVYVSMWRSELGE